MTDRRFVARGFTLVVLTAAVMFSFLGSARLWDRDEPRNARAAQEMLERGDWVVPTFNSELRSHKPVMLYWLQIVAYSVFGQSEFTARLPSAVAAFVSVIAIAWLASRLAGEPNLFGPTGFWSGAVLATCALFVMAGRAATPDSCLIAFSTLGIAALIGGLLVAPQDRSRLATSILKDRLSWRWAAAGYAMLGGAILAKGPVGLILPLLIIHCWWLLVQRRPLEPAELARGAFLRMATWAWAAANPRQVFRSIVALKTVPGIGIAVLIAAPWYIAVGQATDGQFLREFFWQHNVARAVSSMEGHGGSIFFYPAALLVGTFPWSLWLMPIAWWGLKANRRGAAARTSVTLAAVWIGVTIAACTFASTKLPSYITSCYPGVALLVGGFLKDFANNVRMPSRAWRTLAGAVALFVAFGMATGLIWISFSEALPLVGWLGCSSILLALAGVGGWVVDWQSRPRLVPAIWLAAAVLLHVGLFGIGTRTVDSYRSEVDMLVAVDEASQHPSQWYGLGGMEPSWVYYLGKTITAVPDELGKSMEQPEAWRQRAREAGMVDGDHLIVEGDLAEELQAVVRRWPSDRAPLIEQARTERFLRPGNIVVYQFHSPTGDLASRRQADRR
ncbi:MAG: ArnT family glycosyltransferase [Aureliella sp.]